MDTMLLPLIDAARCDGCGYCVTHCPTGALGMVNGQVALVHPSRCNYDATCEDICPAGAIALPYQIVFEQEPPAHEPTE